MKTLANDFLAESEALLTPGDARIANLYGSMATLLVQQNRPTEAIAELDQVLAEEPENPGHANLQAAALGRIGEFDDAIVLYRQVLQKAPNQPRVWMSFGHMLKTVGRLDEGVEAYRKAIELMPTLGEVWWSLANLKTVRFSDQDIAAMQAALASGEVAKDDRFHLDFALGKAFEDRGEPEPAFAHYAAGNALRRTELDYDANETERLVDRLGEQGWRYEDLPREHMAAMQPIAAAVMAWR